MRGMDFELDHLLNPAAVFDHPRDVLNDPDLSRQEKRAILSSWASDACAVESMPGLRQPPGVKAPVSFDDIVDALRRLDDDPPPRPGGARDAAQAPLEGRRRGVERDPSSLKPQSHFCPEKRSCSARATRGYSRSPF